MSNKLNTLKSDMNKMCDIYKNISQHEKTLQELRKQKISIEQNIINVLKDNNWTNNEFQIKQYVFKYQKETKRQPLNQKFIKQALEQYYRTTCYNSMSTRRCQERAKEMLQYMLDLRDTKEVSVLKHKAI